MMTDTPNQRISMCTVVLLGLLATAITLGLMYQQGFFGGSDRTSALAVSVGSIPASALFIIDPQTQSLMPLTLAIEGEELPVLDVLRTTEGMQYYVLAERSEAPRSNVYRMDADGVVTPVTTTPSVKYNLSHDPVTGMLAYQSFDADSIEALALGEPWDIVVLDPMTGTERVLGKGVRPTIIRGGGSVMYQDGDSLSVRAVGGGDPITVLTLPSNVYAVGDAMLAIYNPVTQAVDEYGLVNGTSPSYKGSVDLNSAPDALGYAAGKLVAANTVEQDDSRSFLFFWPGSPRNESIRVTTQQEGIPQRIYAYE